MAFGHGKNTRVYIGGYDLTAFLQKVETPKTQDVAETTVFNISAKTYVAGTVDGSWKAEGIYDPAVGGVDEAFRAGFTSSGVDVWSYLPQGDTIEYPIVFGDTHPTEYNIPADVGDVVKCSAAAQASGGIFHGKVLHPLAQETTTGNDTVVNNGAATTAGGEALIQCTDVSGTTPTLDVVIEDSADGSTGWATIATFTQITADRTAQKVTISGNIRQYTRSRRTIGGTGGPTGTYLTALARK